MNTKIKSYPYVSEGLVYFNENFIVEQFVDVTWDARTKSHYISCGYTFTKMRNVFTLDVRHLPTRSSLRVEAICPICHNTRSSIFANIMKTGHSKCKGCAKITDLTNGFFGRLTVIKYVGTNGHGAMWLCRCECGEMTIVRSDRLTGGVTQSCGCLNLELSSARLSGLFGCKNYMWNPNMTTSEREQQRGDTVQKWAVLVKVRDKFTCQCCGDDRGGNLESHHLNGYRDHPEQRIDLQNGVTLCETCHHKFHSWMGGNRVKCTYDNFTNFCYKYYNDSLFLRPLY